MSWIDERRAELGDERVDQLLQKVALNMPRYVRYAGGDRGFALWLLMVDRAIGFLSHRDLADWHWRDAYDDGVSPREAAEEAVHADLGELI